MLSDSQPVGYPAGATPQDVYNAVLANTGDAAQATQAAGDYASMQAGIWNATPASFQVSAMLPSQKTTAAMSQTGFMLLAGAALLILATAMA